MPSYTRPHGIIGQNYHGSHNNLRGNGSKDAFGSKLPWGNLKDAKVDFKSPLKSYNFDKNVKHEKDTSGLKNYDSWNKAKAKLTKAMISTNFVELMHALIVVRSAISSLIVPIQNLDCLRVV
jgi:hypothetical protein